jgi:hypothetical protein
MNLPFTLKKNNSKKITKKRKTKKVTKKESQNGGNLLDNFSILKKSLNKNLKNKSKNYNNNILIPASKS